MPWLWENFVGPFGDSGGFGSFYTFGNRFTVEAPTDAQALRWYRHRTVAQDKPQWLGIWRQDTHAIVTSVAVPDDLSIGWQSANLPAPVALTPGVIYHVALSPTFGYNGAVVSAASIPAAPFPLLWQATKRSWCSTSPQPCDVTSGTFDNGSCLTADVYVGTTPPPPPPTSDPEEALKRWFDPLEAVYPLSDVKLYPRVIDRLDTLSVGSITWLNNRSAQLVDLLNGVDADAITFLNDAPAALLTSLRTNDTAVQKPDGTRVTAQVDAVLAQLNTIQALAQGNANALARLEVGAGAFPIGWSLVDSVAFNTQIAWPVAADLYTLHLTAWPNINGQVDVAGVTWLPRLGWWAPLNGQFAQGRGFVEFQDSHFHRLPGVLPGILVQTKAGTTGTLEAWNLV